MTGLAMAGRDSQCRGSKVYGVDDACLSRKMSLLDCVINANESVVENALRTSAGGAAVVNAGVYGICRGH